MVVSRKSLFNYLLICIAIFILIYILNYFTLYTSDDFVYRYIYKDSMPTGNEETVKNIFDLITSQVNHWKIWNGRFTAHSIVQIFMQFDKLYFNIFNSFIFVMLVALIERISSNIIKVYPEKLRAIYLTILFFMLWWFLPEIGKTVLWVSGSGNYLWTAVIDLLWIYLFTKSDISKKCLPLTLMLAFFMGAGNENTSPAIILWSVFYFSFHILEQKIPMWKIVEIISAIAGFILMISSPGSHQRAGEISIFENIKDKIVELAQISYTKYSLLYLILALLLTYLIAMKQIKREQLIEIGFMVIAHLACIYSLIASNEKPDRVFFGASMLLCLVVMQLLKLTLEQVRRLKIISIILIFPILIKFGLSYASVIQDNYETYIQVKNQYSQLIEAKKSGQKNVVLKLLKKPRYSYNAYQGTNNLHKESDAWFNQWMAVYFGVKRIEGEE